MVRKHVVGFSGFKPKYAGSVNDDPRVRSLLENRPIEEIQEEINAKKQSAGAAPVPDMPQSEYGCRYQKPIVSTSATADKIVPFDPWDMERRITAELALPRTSIDLSRGAVPGYRGHVPRLRYRFGESYGSLSTHVQISADQFK